MNHKKWRRHTGGYPKARFDVFGKDGTYQEAVWPNAMRFGTIHEEDVAYLRPASLDYKDRPTWKEHAEYWAYDPGDYTREISIGDRDEFMRMVNEN